MSAERRLARWLTTTGVVYAAGAIDFLVRPKAATRSLSMSGGSTLDDEDHLSHSLAGASWRRSRPALTAAATRGARALSRRCSWQRRRVGRDAVRYARTRRRGFAAAPPQTPRYGVRRPLQRPSRYTLRPGRAGGVEVSCRGEWPPQHRSSWYESILVLLGIGSSSSSHVTST